VSEDIEDQSSIFFAAIDRVSRAERARGALRISKAANAHAFLGNDRATLSVRSRFTVISWR
jgi:hypothetical protein